MPSDINRQRLRTFVSEEDWPFIPFGNRFAKCMRFLEETEPSGPRLARLVGPSGTGKTFFTKQVLTEFAEGNDSKIALYLDIAGSDLEAASVLEKLNHILSRPREARRKSPFAVPKDVARSWRAREAPTKSRAKGYIYRVSRDLVAQIPAAGPFLKAFMPPELPREFDQSDRLGTPLQFLASVSRKRPVLVALDNVQNLPVLVQEMLEDELRDAGPNFRLIMVHRTDEPEVVFSEPPIHGMIVEDFQFGLSTLADVDALVAEVLKGRVIPDGFVESVFRRSDGNLKSVWFQLKLFIERLDDTGSSDQGSSYENVIQSLTSLDTTILRTVVVLLGGITISQISELLGHLNNRLVADEVVRSVSDLAMLGLLIVNSETRDRVRVEHDLVSRIVDELTTEDEKLELRLSLVAALSKVLSESAGDKVDDALYDRLIGITHEQEVRQSPLLQSLIVRHIERQHTFENFTYLAVLCRDSVCWQVLDLLPSATVHCVLDAVQKCSLFSFGLVTVERLKQHPTHVDLAWLYEGKFLAQLFKYDEALVALEKAPNTPERELAKYTIKLNLYDNDSAKRIAEGQLSTSSKGQLTEFDLIVLRNSAHLFSRAEARAVVQVAVDGFRRRGLRYGVGTSLNNLGIIELDDGNVSTARSLFQESFDILEELSSPERYQPIVNFSGAAVLDGDWKGALSFVSAARTALPVALPMDLVMLKYNEAAILFLSGKLPEADAVKTFRSLADQALKTRDTRFLEALSWLSNNLASVERCDDPPEPSPIMLDILSPATTRMEIFIETKFMGGTVSVPYILSPHWRH